MSDTTNTLAEQLVKAAERAGGNGASAAAVLRALGKDKIRRCAEASGYELRDIAVQVVNESLMDPAVADGLHLLDLADEVESRS